MKMTFWTKLFIVLAMASSFAQAQAQTAPASAVPAKTAPPAIPLDQQATKEQINKLFEVMRLHDEMQATMKAIPNMVQQQLRTQLSEMYSNLPPDAQPTAEQKAKLDALLNKYMDRAANLYSVDEMMSDVIGIYQRHMSRTDADAYIAFYNSPAGQHLLDAQPLIMQEYMPLVMKRVETASTQLSDEMTRDAQSIVMAPKPAPASK